jgi:hypothetical protein
MPVGTQVAVLPVPSFPPPISLFHRTWPVAGLAIGLVVTVAWTALLGYGLFKLLQPAFL